MRPLPSFCGRSVLVVSPHPDDETIAAFGVICRAVREARRVRIVIVTDGAASHESETWPPPRLAAQRESETLAAMARAGVSRRDVRFLRYPDSGLSKLGKPGFGRLVTALRSTGGADLVFRPSEKDFHADHKIVARACRAAWPRRVRQFSYLVWPEAGQSYRPRFELKLGKVRAMKRSAICAYRSQTGLIKDDPHGFTMSRNMVSAFCPPAETFEPG